MAGPAPAPRPVLVCGIYNSSLSLKTTATEKEGKGPLVKSHPNQEIALRIPAPLWEILQFEHWYNPTWKRLKDTDVKK